MEILHDQGKRISRRDMLMKFLYAPTLVTITIPLVAMKQLDAAAQGNWRWCYKCEGLWFAGHNTHGVCPADGNAHILAGSGNYVLLSSTDPTASGQNNWRWCHKCEGLWFAGHPTHGVCPADGAEHSRKGSGDYVLA